MNTSNKLLSDIVAFRTYARHLPSLGRRESLEETINRNMNMHLDRFPKLSKDIVRAYSHVHEHEVMPSMRGMQFAGQAVVKNNARQYNCAYLPIDDARAFGEVLFLLLSGTGVGFSVQGAHINKLPHIQEPREEGAFLVQDSIIGWAQALDVLFEAYAFGRVRPLFDFFQIRAKGSLLVTTGARAPGPEPLKHMLIEVEKRLRKAIGRHLTDIEVHDIICIISDCVLAGGIRRAALISLFDRDSDAMLHAKSGEWYTQHPYRARANNSALLPRSKVTKEEFEYIFNITRNSGAGEPGFSWSNDPDMGFNPCHEVSLQAKQFCNLTTVNQTGIVNKSDFLARVQSAAFIATLQAAYTDFPYLRPDWKVATESESLIGVSFTGIADSGKAITAEWLREGAQLVLDTNARYAKRAGGINLAARSTVLKPEGSSSAVLGSASGIHARHAPYYLRRIRINADDAVAKYLKTIVPGLVEEAKAEANTVIITIPQESPVGAICRKDESAIDLLSRVVMYNKNWIAPGHRSGANMNNVSATVSVREDEWDAVSNFMWTNRDHYTGIALLPYDGGNYIQAPFQDCTKTEFEDMSKLVSEIDLRQVIEVDDNTTRSDLIACGSLGGCEVR